MKDVEFATLEWVAWFNTKRLLEPIGHVPPVELEEEYNRQQEPAQTERWRFDEGGSLSGEIPGSLSAKLVATLRATCDTEAQHEAAPLSRMQGAGAP